jgi:hypothetical protein
LGLVCHFIDDWEPYFLGRGEIHSGGTAGREIETSYQFDAKTNLKPLQRRGNIPKTQKYLKPRYISKLSKSMPSICLYPCSVTLGEANA